VFLFFSFVQEIFFSAAEIVIYVNLTVEALNIPKMLIKAHKSRHSVCIPISINYFIVQTRFICALEYILHHFQESLLYFALILANSGRWTNFPRLLFPPSVSIVTATRAHYLSLCTESHPEHWACFNAHFH